jgi:hypothetical protein
VDMETQTIVVDRNMRLKSFCSLRMPGEALVRETRLHPCAVLVAEVKSADSGKMGLEDRWKIDGSAPPALDETLFGE